jgi:hypothetical protein
MDKFQKFARVRRILAALAEERHRSEEKDRKVNDAASAAVAYDKLDKETCRRRILLDTCTQLFTSESGSDRESALRRIFILTNVEAELGNRLLYTMITLQPLSGRLGLSSGVTHSAKMVDILVEGFQNLFLLRMCEVLDDFSFSEELRLVYSSATDVDKWRELGHRAIVRYLPAEKSESEPSFFYRRILENMVNTNIWRKA